MELQNKHRGVIVIYPVRENPKDSVSIGFELFFPNNQLPFELNFIAKGKVRQNDSI